MLKFFGENFEVYFDVRQIERHFDGSIYSKEALKSP